MIMSSRLWRHVLLASALTLLVLGLGCASQSSSHLSTQAIQAAQEIPQEQLLDVGITIFDPGLPPEGQPVPDDVFPELRKAESRFQAIQLMDTMQSTGQWGAVRVLPAGHGTTDLRVSGTILLSTGLKMALDIRAVDARGKVWLERRYRGQADEAVYLGSEVSRRDPFQSIYNEISNDLLQARSELRAGELQEVRQVSRLQFAANLAPHNLGEVCDAVTLMCSRWRSRAKITVDDLLEVIPGPDFPTGGLAFRYRLDRQGSEDVRTDAIRAAYETGNAGIVCQARMNVERQDSSRSGEQIVITAIPYGQQKSTIIQRVANEARNGKISGVVDIVDESDREGMRVVVQVSRQADPSDVLEMLVRRSTLRSTFGVNNLVLVPQEVDGKRIVAPRTLSLKEILEQFVLHRLEVIQRRSKYELARRRARLHIVEGLLIALDNIDEVIDTIRRSRTVDTARTNLMRKFKLTEIQATAILDMQLRRLAAMERAKLKDEEKELKARIKYLEALLASQAKQLDLIKEETAEIKTKYATPRRTTIVDAAPGEGTSPVTTADLAVPDDPQCVALTTAGIVRSKAADYAYRVSTGATSRAVVAHLGRVQTEPTDRVFFVSSGGNIWLAPVGQVPERAKFGEMGLKRDEEIVSVEILRPEGYLVLGTEQGKVKRTDLSVVESMPERLWSEIMGLSGGDRVVFAGVCGEDGEVLFFTNSKVLRIKADVVSNQQTPSARGVAGIKLAKDDVLLGGSVVADPKGYMVFVVSAKGYVKRVPIDEFPFKGRGTMGVMSLNQTKVTGPVAAAGAGRVARSTTVDVLGQDGKRQRMSLRGIPIENRPNRGKKLVKLAQPRHVVVLE